MKCRRVGFVAASLALALMATLADAQEGAKEEQTIRVWIQELEQRIGTLEQALQDAISLIPGTTSETSVNAKCQDPFAVFR